jgi:hypothetical protein
VRRLDDISKHRRLPGQRQISHGGDMSGDPEGGEDAVRSAVPVPDLAPIDAALRAGGDPLKAAVKQVPPADITTRVDASGLFIYFSVAHLMIAQLH